MRRSGGTVLTMDPHLGDLERGDVLTEGGRDRRRGPGAGGRRRDYLLAQARSHPRIADACRGGTWIPQPYAPAESTTVA